MSSKSKHNPDAPKFIEEYIREARDFAQPICRKLRAIIFKAEPDIIEDWKWGPNYYKSGIVCGFGAFKQHVTLAFFQGAMLKDPKKILTEDGSKTPRSLRLGSRASRKQSLESPEEKGSVDYTDSE